MIDVPNWESFKDGDDDSTIVPPPDINTPATMATNTAGNNPSFQGPPAPTPDTEAAEESHARMAAGLAKAESELAAAEARKKIELGKVKQWAAKEDVLHTQQMEDLRLEEEALEAKKKEEAALRRQLHQVEQERKGMEADLDLRKGREARRHGAELNAIDTEQGLVLYRYNCQSEMCKKSIASYKASHVTTTLESDGAVGATNKDSDDISSLGNSYTTEPGVASFPLMDHATKVPAVSSRTNAAKTQSSTESVANSENQADATMTESHKESHKESTSPSLEGKEESNNEGVNTSSQSAQTESRDDDAAVDCLSCDDSLDALLQETDEAIKESLKKFPPSVAIAATRKEIAATSKSRDQEKGRSRTSRGDVTVASLPTRAIQEDDATVVTVATVASTATNATSKSRGGKKVTDLESDFVAPTAPSRGYCLPCPGTNCSCVKPLHKKGTKVNKTVTYVGLGTTVYEQLRYDVTPTGRKVVKLDDAKIAAIPEISRFICDWRRSHVECCNVYRAELGLEPAQKIGTANNISNDLLPPAYQRYKRK